MVFPLQVGNIAENQFWGSTGGIGKKQWKTDTWVTLTVPFRLSATCSQNPASPHSSSSAYSSNCSISTTIPFQFFSTWQNTCFSFMLTVPKLQTEVTLTYSVRCPLSYIAVALDCPKPRVTLHLSAIRVRPASESCFTLTSLEIRRPCGDHVKIIQ